jgi:hypothetical protein
LAVILTGFTDLGLSEFINEFWEFEIKTEQISFIHFEQFLRYLQFISFDVEYINTVTFPTNFKGPCLKFRLSCGTSVSGKTLFGNSFLNFLAHYLGWLAAVICVFVEHKGIFACAFAGEEMQDYFCLRDLPSLID